jgi:hypothetical protein
VLTRRYGGHINLPIHVRLHHRGEGNSTGCYEILELPDSLEGNGMRWKLALLAVLTAGACDTEGHLLVPPEPLFSTYAGCALQGTYCDDLLPMLSHLSIVHASTEGCNTIINNALDRFHSENPDVGFKHGGSSETVSGFIVKGSEVTYITTLGYTALIVTALHEEAHHYGIESESQAEQIGQSCGDDWVPPEEEV